MWGLITFCYSFARRRALFARSGLGRRTLKTRQRAGNDSNSTVFHGEGGKGDMPKVAHFEMRPDPLADRPHSWQGVSEADKEQRMPTKTKDEAGAQKSGAGKKLNPALTKPMQPSKELAEIVGSAPLARSAVVSKIWDYIKAAQASKSGKSPRNPRRRQARADFRQAEGDDVRDEQISLAASEVRADGFLVPARSEIQMTDWQTWPSAPASGDFIRDEIRLRPRTTALRRRRGRERLRAPNHGERLGIDVGLTART